MYFEMEQLPESCCSPSTLLYVPPEYLLPQLATRPITLQNWNTTKSSRQRSNSPDPADHGHSKTAVTSVIAPQSTEVAF